MDNNSPEKLAIPSLITSTYKVKLPEQSLSVHLVSEDLNCYEEVETSKNQNQNTIVERIRNKSDNCLFCKNNVTNFARHIARKHKNEIEVKKFMAFPKGSPERKLLADLLRKRGNFLCHIKKKNKIRIVRSPNKNAKMVTTVSDYLPCKHCLGMFKKKFLHRHLKICKNNKNKAEGRNRAQADGQNMMLDLSDVDTELVEKVFSRMVCDNISFVAKSDKLITSFGTKCLKTYQDKRIVTSISQKMRTLARFLIAMRNEVNTIHSLQDCLSSNYFGAIIKCAKKIGRHNGKMDNCKPSLSFINLRNLLKNCCDLAAELKTLKKSDDQFQKDQNSFNNMKKLITNNWSNQFTSLDENCSEIVDGNHSEVLCPITSLLPNTGDIISNKISNNSTTESLKCIDLHQVYDTNSEFQKSTNNNNIKVLHQNTKQSYLITDNAVNSNNLLPKVGLDSNTENKISNECIIASSSTETQTPQKSRQCKISKAYNKESDQLKCSSQPKINTFGNNLPVWIKSDNSNSVDDVKTSSERKTPRKMVRDKFNFCLFCEKNVTNFARHIVRNHKNETEVAKYNALPKGSAERKFQVDLLRKRGNFLNHVQNGNKMKLVRRPKEFETKIISIGDYLPCKFCLGMFKKKLMHRHVKICKNNKNEGRNRAQADGQNLMLNLTDLDEELVRNVFPRMIGDNTSFVAKSDKLITSFGVKYLKSHKGKKIISSVSQQMRILARFLIAMKCEDSSTHSLQDYLNPKYFDSIIKCTKKIGQYNEEMDIYESPSIVVKLGSLLKNCCDIATELIMLKENDGLLHNKYTEDLESIKNIKYMIDVNWAYQFMSLNKKYIDMGDKSTNELCLADYTNILPEIDLNDFINSKSDNNMTVPLKYFGHQQSCTTDATSQKFNFRGNTEIFDKNREELCPINCNGLPCSDVDNRENKKNIANLEDFSLMKTPISTKDIQHTNNTSHYESSNAKMVNEHTNSSSDSFNEDSRNGCLPCVDHLSIENSKHHKSDSTILEKSENSQFPLNTLSADFSEDNFSKPLESDNSSVDEEIKTRSKTVTNSKRIKDKLNYDSNISKKGENSQLPLNTLSANFSKDNFSKPLESDNSNIVEEIKTRSKTVTKSKRIRNKLNYDSNISKKGENSQFPLNKLSTNSLEEDSSMSFESDNSNLNEKLQTRSKTVKNNKINRNKSNYCLFCEKNVKNFTRHLVRKHKNEIEVAKFESLPKNSTERKLQADLLRKRGNFLCHIEKGKEIKVVRRSKEFETKSTSVCDYLPCKYCFGMFKKKYLHRHLKVCKCVKNKTMGRNRAQADGQNMMLKLDNMDDNLVANVFRRMACDDISFVAKSDKLITNFASNYLKNHNEKQSIAVVTQKMRILARFVIAMKGEVSTIRSLQDCLTPEHFDTIIKCSKKVAQFNEKTNSFGSRSTVIKLGQLLKHCCDVAISPSLKESANELLHSNEKDKESCKNIKYMIENHWLFKLSTHDCEELNLDTCYSPTLLALTSDIILLRNNIIHFEKESYCQLKSNPNNILAYQNLQESILAQIILLNRYQADEEIQFISLDMFNNSLSDVSQEINTQAFSPVQQHLSKYFKCINIQDKHGEIVSIWLTLQLFKLIQYLLKLRITANFINCANPYLFPSINSANSSMKVCDIISKFGEKSGAEQLENITSTRFKKYVATITQLLYLTEKDIENLTSFIRYNKDIHREPDRITDNTLKVAKLCKLLLLKEKCEGHGYLEKSINDININVDDIISDDDQETNDENKYILGQTFLTPDLSNKQKSLTEGKLSSLNQTSSKRQQKISDLKKKVLWSSEDKDIITKYFEMHIILGNAPRKQECEELSKLYPQINKPWKKIKDFVHNTTNALKRKNNKFCVL